MNEFGKIIFVFGLGVALIGLVLWSGIGKDWFGRLPGDIRYTRENFTIYFPIVTCILVSLLLTCIFWLFRR